MSRDKKLEPTQPYAPVEKMENNTEIVKLTQRVTTLEEEVGELKRMYHDAFRTKPTTTAASKVAKAASNIVPTVPKETGNQKQSAPVKKYVSIDVECVATGPGHNDRAPCSVAIVDLDETELLNAFFRPTIPIFSYLTELTGIRESDLVGCGDTLEDVRPLIAKCLGPDTVIVGQNPQGDIEWLNLKEGKDYDSLIDLSVVFEATDKRRGQVRRFSLMHEATCLLGESASTEHHSALGDCINAVKLYKEFGSKGAKVMTKAKNKLLHSKPLPNVVKQNDYVLDGVCMAGFYPKKCICGQISKATAL